MHEISTAWCTNKHIVHVNADNIHAYAYNIQAYTHVYRYALTWCSHIDDECTDTLVLGRLIRGGEQ